MSYNYNRLVNDFLHQRKNKYNQIASTTADNRMSYSGTTLYSYNSVLAELIGHTVIIYESTAKYSVTSAKHASILRNYTNNFIDIPDYYVKNDLETFLLAIFDMFKKQMNAKSKNYLEGLPYLLKEALTLVKLKKYDKRSYEVKALNRIFNSLENNFLQTLAKEYRYYHKRNPE